MAKHRFHPTRFYNVIGTAEPCLTIADGDTVVTDTIDAIGFDADEVSRASRPNPQTGPFFVTGAEPGDTLAVRIDRMTPSRRTGWTFSPLATTVLEPGVIRDQPEHQMSTWLIDNAAGTARLEVPPQGLENFAVPLAPMIGCFGVAPPHGQAIYTATSAANGGNMDYRLFGPGTTAWFPVSMPGALFYLGDGHACQGDGEIVGTGIETSFEVEFTVQVLKRTHRLAARRDRRRHLHRRQCPAARAGAAACHHRDAALARRGLWARAARRQPPARPGRPLRRRATSSTPPSASPAASPSAG